MQVTKSTAVLVLIVSLWVVNCACSTGTEEVTVEIDHDGNIINSEADKEHVDASSVPVEEPLEIEAGGFTKVWEDLSIVEQNKLYTRFYQWLESENVQYAPSEIKIQNDLRGLYLKEDLAKDHALATIPRHIMLTTIPPDPEQPKDTPFCDLTRRWPLGLLSKVFDNSSSVNIAPPRAPTVLLALCLIHETKKEGGSFYQPYLDILPKRLSQPLMWKQESLMQLQSSPLLPAIISAKDQLRADYRLLADRLFTHPNQGFTMAHYNWAMLTITTRAIELPLAARGPRPFKALVPLVDLLNFSPDNLASSVLLVNETTLPSVVQSEGTATVDPAYRFSLSRSFTSSEQLYNDRSNCANSFCFLLNHGFIPENIEYDHIPLTIVTESGELQYLSLLNEYAEPSALSDSVLALKVNVLATHKLTVVPLLKDYAVDIIAVFRILCAAEDETELFSEALQSRPISARNEICVSKSIHDLISSSLESYPTTLQYDKMIYKHLPKEETEIKLAVQIRMTEKVILHSILKSVDSFFANQKSK